MIKNILKKLFPEPKPVTIDVNGNITISGNNVNIVNGKIFVDGVEYRPDTSKSSDIIKIENVIIEGNVSKLSVGIGNVVINGNVETSLEAPQGDISVTGYVNGNITCEMGDVIIHGTAHEIKADMSNVTIEGDVIGNVIVDMGDVTVKGSVQGSTKVDMGDITVHNKV